MRKRIIPILLTVTAFLMVACQGKETPVDPSPPDPTVDPEEEVFPIIAWTGIKSNETSWKFTPMKEAGVNVYLGWYDTLAEVMQALEDAEKAGVKLIIKSDELFSDVSGTVKRMRECPALFGYHISDEPSVSDFALLSQIVKSIQRYDSDHPCYINLYPNWAWGGNTGYLGNVNNFLNQVPVTFLSFDNYPIREINGVTSLRDDWYKNLEDIRTASRARKMPFWAFALALSHKLNGFLYPVPSIGHLRLQQFSNLVYGAQAFQYFTWWGAFQGTKTAVYDRVKQVNEELQGLAPVFYGAEVKAVWHTGSSLPFGTSPVSHLPDGVESLVTEDIGTVVSYIEKNGKCYFAIVNKDFALPRKITVKLGPNVKQVLKDGTMVPAVSGEVEMPAGDIIVYNLK